MKNKFQRLVSLSFATLFAIFCSAATVTLTFSGETTEGRYCLLDSVKIENLTENWEETVDCEQDTSYNLVVETVTAIDDVYTSSEYGRLLSIQNYAFGVTTFSINPLEDGIVQIRVTDMYGRVIMEHGEFLYAGTHQYALQLSVPQVYILSVKTTKESAAAKVINMSATNHCDLSRVTSLPRANVASSPRRVKFNDNDLMRYTGYTTQKGVAVASEPIVQRQYQNENIVFTFSPVDKFDEGMYVGMMGFNSQLYPYAFDILDASNLFEHRQFVTNLNMGSGTILYHAVYTALDSMVLAPVPQKLENVSLVTFTDGLDIGSWRMNSNYPSEALYLAAVNRLINRTYIDGIKLDAYSIGVKGSDVTDVERFDSDLHQLASDSANVYSVSNMEEVNARFREIAAKIYNTKVSYSLTFKVPAPEPGSIIRFTFDDVTDAKDAVYYIEGTYDYDFNAGMGVLKNVTYSGIKCSNGTTWESTPDGIFDVFTIRNITNSLGEQVSTSTMRQWTYIPSSDSWQVNSEFSPSTNTTTMEEHTSAIVMLVLDCSSSLSSDFSKMQNAANSFLNILAGQGNISTPSVSKATYVLGDLQVTMSASVTNTGNLTVLDKGFCVSENPNMDDAEFYSAGAGVDEFEFILTGLSDGKTYYCRPYAENQLGRTYGTISSVTAIAYIPPVLQTSEASNITTNSAKCGGNVTFNGYLPVTERGICWGTAPNPTIEDTILVLGSGTGTFSGTISNLQDGTTYYVRAWAKNDKGVGYGEEVSFTTIAIIPPTVSTADITDVTISGATCGGNVTNDGNAAVVERGICWSTSPNPTIEDNILALGSGMGSFSGTISDLQDGTTYYVRAYAKNNKEVGYGAEISFTTVAIVAPTVSTAEVTDVLANSVSCGGSVTFDGNSPIVEQGLCWSTSPNSTIENSTLILSTANSAFSGTILNLEDGVTYYVRAYARNSKKVGYGEELSFTTLEIIQPTVVLSSAAVVSAYTVSGNGEVTFDGNSAIIERGFCWSTSPNPTINDHFISIGAGGGTYNGNIPNVTANDSVYIRAYAKNKKKIAYSEEIHGIYMSVIEYAASQKLVETTKLNGTENGLHTQSFDLPIFKHEFANGTGTITFNGILTNIGEYAFYRCAELSSIEIPNSVINIGGSVFSGCSSLTSFDIPEGVTSIESYVFRDCSSIVSVTIPNNVTRIRDGAFIGCSGLISIEIPNGVDSIGEFAFQACAGLTSIEIPNSVTSIEKFVFSDCSGLTSFEIPSSVKIIRECAFYRCTGLTELVIPNGVDSIEQYAFFGVPNICYSGSASGTPWGARCINGYVEGLYVYRDSNKTHLVACSSVANGTIAIADGVISIGDSAFFMCQSLTSVMLPNSVTSIEKYAFYECLSLHSIEISNSVKGIGDCAFMFCSSLTSIEIPNSVTSIGRGAFCFSGLISIIIPDSITSISSGLCQDCRDLNNVEIGASVTTISSYAFSGCTSLSSITIPEGVTKIGSYAFQNCTGLANITNYAVQPQTIYASEFKNVNKNTCKLYVPTASVNAYKAANNWKDFKNILPISE